MSSDFLGFLFILRKPTDTGTQDGGPKEGNCASAQMYHSTASKVLKTDDILKPSLFTREPYVRQNIVDRLMIGQSRAFWFFLILLKSIGLHANSHQCHQINQQNQ